jgi:hypothetical protein
MVVPLIPPQHAIAAHIDAIENPKMDHQQDMVEHDTEGSIPYIND